MAAAAEMSWARPKPMPERIRTDVEGSRGQLSYVGLGTTLQAYQS